MRRALVTVAAAALACQGCHLIFPFSVLPADAGATDAELGEADLGRLEQGGPDAAPGCTIDDSYYEPGTRHDADACRMCDPAVSRHQWSAAPGCVVTLAGSGKQGSTDGVALEAELDMPIAVAADGAGRVYIADWRAHRVRLLWQGKVSTAAGDGTEGHVDGPAASARLSAPMGLGLGVGGALYISDKNGQRIRLLSQGQVSTVAGNGKAAFADGAALSASFNGPQGLAVSQSGAVYAADSSNNRVRKIASGVVSTLCGSAGGWADGPVASAKLAFPTAVAVEPSGNGAVIVADEQNHVIRRVTGGQVTTLAGTPGSSGSDDGAAGSARFSAPHDVAVDAAGAVYVADCGNGRIRKIQSGKVSTVAGGWGFADGPFASARFACPVSIDLDDKGHLFVADIQNRRIRVLNLNP